MGLAVMWNAPGKIHARLLAYPDDCHDPYVGGAYSLALRAPGGADAACPAGHMQEGLHVQGRA
jgi:hypothetical protein